jgi:ESX secretion system protein EccD
VTAAAVAAPRRVTVAGPAGRVDVSLPPQATVAELVPQLAGMLGANRTQSGWTLGRLGAGTMDAASTVVSAGIRDGEVLYLHAAGAQPLPVVFDDVAEAVAAHDKGRWQAGHGRAAALAVAFLALAAVGAGLPGWWGAAFATLPFFLGTTCARTFHDGVAGAVIAAAGIPAVALGLGTQAGVAAACAAVVAYAAGAAAIAPAGRAWFTGMAVAAFLAGLSAFAVTLLGFPASSVAACAVAAALLLTPLLPSVALRLGGVPLPSAPADTFALRGEAAPPVGAEVFMAAGAANRVLTALLAAVVAVVLAAVGVLLATAPPWSFALIVLCGLALLLRARSYVHIGQRLALLGGGLLVLGAAAAWLAIASGTMRAAVGLAVLAVGAACLTRAVRGGAPPSPYWPRLFDIVEFLVLASLIPVALAVLDVYSFARSLGV